MDGQCVLELNLVTGLCLALVRTFEDGGKNESEASSSSICHTGSSEEFDKV